MSGRIYIHETMVITVKHRKDYLDLVTRVWAPTSRRLYGMRNFGVWATVGSAGPWPEAIILWELDGPDALSAMLSGEFVYLRDQAAEIHDHYQTFWQDAPEGVRDTSGFDRLLAQRPHSPGIEEAIRSGIKGAAYYQETITTRPGGILGFLDRYEAEWRPLAESHGLRFISTFRTLLRNDAEAVILWALPSWQSWAQIDAMNRDPRAARFHAATAELSPDWHGKLLAPAAANPLNTGAML
jgi:hypothetical protein